MNSKKPNAVLARRVARELTIDEMRTVSGGAQTDWSKDYRGGDGTSGIQVVSTGRAGEGGGDFDYRADR